MQDFLSLQAYIGFLGLLIPSFPKVCFLAVLVFLFLNFFATLSPSYL